MRIHWLLISIIIGGVFVYLNNLKKFKTNFYSSLSKSQLQEEIFNILDLILNHHSKVSNFENTSLKNYSDLKNLIHYYISEIGNENTEVIHKLSFEFYPKGVFYELYEVNNQKIEFEKISKTLSIIYKEYLEKID